MYRILSEALNPSWLTESENALGLRAPRGVEPPDPHCIFVVDSAHVCNPAEPRPPAARSHHCIQRFGVLFGDEGTSYS